MTAPSERAFITFRRGQIRDDALAIFRNGLRLMVNPDTGLPFTEEEVRYATQPGSRIYIRQDAIDLIGQSIQQRARYTAQQIDPRTSASAWLRNYWVPLWLPDGALPATPSQGLVIWGAQIGDTFVGSTTPGDPAAFQFRDDAGNLFQASVTVGPATTSSVTIPVIAVQGGNVNPKDGDTFTATLNRPAGADPTGTAHLDFAGGFDAESDADLLKRLLDIIKYRPGSGNAPQFRAWARASDVGVENAWVYSTALYANSVLVCVLQKRSGALGPNGRIASPALLAAVRNYLTPPGSPVVPGRPYVLVQTATVDPIDLSMTLSMRKNSVGGWNDSSPWPQPVLIGGDATTGFCRIGTFFSSTNFFLSSATKLPNNAPSLSGTACPAMMIWDRTRGTFEKLSVASVVDNNNGTYQVTLNVAPNAAIGLNSVICPFSELAVGASINQLGEIAQAAQNYFDSLGPGEAVDLANDSRGAWAYRWPEPSNESPYEAGQSIVTTMFDALGQALGGAQVIFVSHTIPTLPADLTLGGPSLITIHDFGVYSS